MLDMHTDRRRMSGQWKLMIFGMVGLLLSIVLISVALLVFAQKYKTRVYLTCISRSAQTDAVIHVFSDIRERDLGVVKALGDTNPDESEAIMGRVRAYDYLLANYKTVDCGPVK